MKPLVRRNVRSFAEGPVPSPERPFRVAPPPPPRAVFSRPGGLEGRTMSDEREQRTPEDWPYFGEEPLSVERLEDRGDGRGGAFYLPADALEWLGPVGEVHLVEARPGAVRGNHLHRRRREVIVVRATGPWELAWRPPGGDTARRTFREAGAWLLAVEPETPHAIRNLGEVDLVILSCSSGHHDPDDPDTEPVSLLG